MDITTHALIPVLAAAVFDGWPREKGKRRGLFSAKQLVLIGLFGAGPDLLNPHISLEARYASWSHSLLFWGALTLGLLVCSLAKRKACPVYLGLWFSGAYLLHILCDAISGGVVLLFTVSPVVTGRFWVHPVWWIPLDVMFLLAAYGLFRVAPMVRRARKRG